MPEGYVEPSEFYDSQPVAKDSNRTVAPRQQDSAPPVSASQLNLPDSFIAPEGETLPYVRQKYNELRSLAMNAEASGDMDAAAQYRSLAERAYITDSGIRNAQIGSINSSMEGAATKLRNDQTFVEYNVAEQALITVGGLFSEAWDGIVGIGEAAKSAYNWVTGTPFEDVQQAAAFVGDHAEEISWILQDERTAGIIGSEALNAFQNMSAQEQATAFLGLGVGPALKAAKLVTGIGKFVSSHKIEFVEVKSTGLGGKQAGAIGGIRIVPKDINPTRTINGRKIINSDLAGMTVKTKGGDVVFDNDGFPDFTPYSLKTVRIDGLTGDMSHDVPLAMERAGINVYDDANYVWHHHQDAKTMMLVPRTVHSVRNGGVAHTGGRAVIQHNLAYPNNMLNYPSPDEFY